MKKAFAKLISLAMTIVMLIGIVSACDLVTVNKDLDMGQVIATVQIRNSEGKKLVEAEDIYKKDLTAGFLSYGYQYVTQYQYTTSQAYQTVLDNLVSNKIIVQHSEYAMADKKNLDKDNIKNNDIDFLLKYLQQDFETLANGYKAEDGYYLQLQVEYNLKKNVNDLIDAYVEEDSDEEDEPVEDEEITARATPTAADRDFTVEEMTTEKPLKDEYDIAKVTLKDVANVETTYDTIYKLDVAVFKAYKIDADSTSERSAAVAKLIKFLKENGLVEDKESYSTNDILEYSYFKNMRKTLVENAIVSLYEESLKSESEKTLDGTEKDYVALWDEYVREYQSQEALYTSDISAYETALESISDTSFVLCNPYSGYGYVKNILIPFSAEQSEILTNFSEGKDTKVYADEIKAKRKEIAASIVAQDQRDTWVKSNYGEFTSTSTADKTIGEITFDDKYLISDETIKTPLITALNKYIGSVKVSNADGKTEKDDNGVDQTTWKYTEVTPDEIAFNTFFSTYVTNNTSIQNLIFDDKNVSTTIGQITYNDELDEKLDEIMYAFSSDTGCLGKEYGYAYSPATSDTKYVAEFATAAKEVVNKGVGAYTTVLTDYGYHIIICTKLVDANATYTPNDFAKFKADIDKEGTLAYKYRQAKLDTLLSSNISRISQQDISGYLNNEDYKSVCYFEKTYKDLITE